MPELLGVAVVQFRHHIQFGMASARGIGPDAPDPRPHRPVQIAREMRRVRTVHHVEQGAAPGRRLDLGDGVEQRLAVRQPAIGFQRERQHMRQARAGCRAGYADGLARMGHGDGGDHVRPGRCQRLDLRPVHRHGRVGRQRCLNAVTIARRSHHTIDHDGQVRRFVDFAKILRKGHGAVVDGRNGGLVHSHARTPAHVGPPGSRVQHEPRAAVPGDGDEMRQIAGQRRPARFAVQKNE